MRSPSEGIHSVEHAEPIRGNSFSRACGAHPREFIHVVAYNVPHELILEALPRSAQQRRSVNL